MVVKKVIIAVDAKFFKNIFEPKRKRMEKKVGINLSQTKFTSMITDFHINLPKPESLNKRTRGRKRNGLFML